MSATSTIYRGNTRSGQRGGIAIIVALSGAVLLGFVGIALDVGRLYINKTELQTAADACALAAAAQLTCEAPPGVNCPAAFLQNAQAAGLFAAGRNRRDFQSDAVVLTANDVKFSTSLAPNANYLSIAAGANVNSRYAMCTANAGGILPWFMLAMSGINLPSKVARGQIASAIDVVIQTNRLTDGKRKLISISEITGLEGEVISMQDIFTFRQTGVDTDGTVRGHFQASGVRPRFMERLKARGITLPDALFDPSRRME